jgi:hypothetical protein
MVGCHHRQLLRLTFVRLSSSISIAAVAAWWLDGGERVEIDDGLQGGGGGVPKAARHRVAPRREFELRGEQLGDGIAPAPWSGAVVGGAPIAGLRSASLSGCSPWAVGLLA